MNVENFANINTLQICWNCFGEGSLNIPFFPWVLRKFSELGEIYLFHIPNKWPSMWEELVFTYSGKVAKSCNTLYFPNCFPHILSRYEIPFLELRYLQFEVIRTMLSFSILFLWFGFLFLKPYPSGRCTLSPNSFHGDSCLSWFLRGNPDVPTLLWLHRNVLVFALLTLHMKIWSSEILYDIHKHFHNQRLLCSWKIVCCTELILKMKNGVKPNNGFWNPL